MTISKLPHPPATITVIGLGNSMAGDDGLGPRVIALLDSAGAPSNVRVRAISAPGPEMVDLLGAPGEVWFVDAARAPGLPPGEIIAKTIEPGDDAGLVGAPSLVSSHGLSLAELLRLASALGRRRATVRLWGVVGERFEAGDGLSPSVESAVGELARRLADEWRALPRGGGSE